MSPYNYICIEKYCKPLTVFATSSSNRISFTLLSASVLTAIFCNSTSSRARENCCSRSFPSRDNSSLHCSYIHKQHKQITSKFKSEGISSYSHGYSVKLDDFKPRAHTTALLIRTLISSSLAAKASLCCFSKSATVSSDDF